MATEVELLSEVIRRWSAEVDRLTAQLDIAKRALSLIAEHETDSHPVLAGVALVKMQRIADGLDSPLPPEAETPQWWGVWGSAPGDAGHWHGDPPLQTTRTEAARTAKALNEFSAERTDALGWRYEVRPWPPEAEKERA